jgi:anti-sigma regulatory factor (Ser/Thr protein kinase)
MSSRVCSNAQEGMNAANEELQSTNEEIVHAATDEPSLDSDLRALCLEASRELRFNAAKHSGAHLVSMEIRASDGRVLLTVKDDGRGFDPETAAREHGSGFGLFSIHERLSALGGRMQIHSQPGAGTLVELDLPLSLMKLEEPMIGDRRSDGEVIETLPGAIPQAQGFVHHVIEVAANPCAADSRRFRCQIEALADHAGFPKELAIGMRTALAQDRLEPSQHSQAERPVSGNVPVAGNTPGEAAGVDLLQLEQGTFRWLLALPDEVGMQSFAQIIQLFQVADIEVESRIEAGHPMDQQRQVNMKGKLPTRQGLVQHLEQCLTRECRNAVEIQCTPTLVDQLGRSRRTGHRVGTGPVRRFTEGDWNWFGGMTGQGGNFIDQRPRGMPTA